MMFPSRRLIHCVLEPTAIHEKIILHFNKEIPHQGYYQKSEAEGPIKEFFVEGIVTLHMQSGYRVDAMCGLAFDLPTIALALVQKLAVYWLRECNGYIEYQGMKKSDNHGKYFRAVHRVLKEHFSKNRPVQEVRRRNINREEIENG